MTHIRRGVVSAFHRQRFFEALLAVALVVGLAGVGISQASTPPSSSLTVPSTVGVTVTDTWTGEIPPLANATSDCSFADNSTVSDQHLVTVNVPAGTYDAVQANFTFNISWDGSSGNDEILTVVDPDGHVVGSSDTGQPSETVRATNLKAGTYKVIACGFLSGPAPQSYTGTLTVQTVAPPPPAPPLPTSSNGITFDHANLNDPVRMVGEPDVVIDNHGGTYVSGPGGSTTQASWFWKSDDKGIQWYLIGCPAKSNCQNGGGDTEITIANNRDVFASDLQTLQCNSTFRSYDEGKTFLPGEGCFPETDRQWMGLYDPNSRARDRRIYLGANHVAGFSGCYVLVSTDNGVTYVPPDPTNNPAANIGGSCIGRFAVDPNNGEIFVPVSGGTRKSSDGGVTWTKLPGPGAVGNFFAPLVLDTAGNLWQAWTDTQKTYVSYSLDRGQTWHSPIQVSHPGIQQTDFVWLTVGDPGRVAVVFYGTTDTQRDASVPAYGGPNALWHAYASISTNALDSNPTFTQVQATEHVMHRGPICNGGFPGCLLHNSDRSMADFFMVDKDPQGRIFIAYNENSDLSQVSPGQYIGKPINAVIRLRTGPSLFASQGKLLPDPTPANVAINSVSTSGSSLSVSGTHGLPPGNWATDPAGDARFPVWLPNGQAGPSHPALDLREASAGDDGTNLTFKLKLADLSAAALADAATTGGTPSWMVTWWESKGGIGPDTMTPPFHSHWFVKWLGGSNFVYGRVSSIDAPALGAPTPKFLTYTPSGSASGSVNGNEVTISVPLASLGGLTAGDKIDHVAAYGMVEHADVTLNDWADQAKTFSYRIGTPAAAQHLPDGYVQVSLDPSFTSPTLATLNPANNTWTASIAGAPSSGTVYARQILSKDLYTSVWDDVQAGPVAQRTFFFPAAVSIDKSTYPDPNQTIAHLGQPVTFRIAVTNAGPADATGLKVVDTFTKNAGFVSSSSISGAWSCVGKTTRATVTCTLSGALAKGQTAVVQLVLKPTAKGTLTNTACESAPPADTEDCDAVTLTVMPS
ncbi:MAG TPA: hypothetical protein VGJ27_10885 [Gaiellaceae bacterium]